MRLGGLDRSDVAGLGEHPGQGQVPGAVRHVVVEHPATALQVPGMVIALSGVTAFSCRTAATVITLLVDPGS